LMSVAFGSPVAHMIVNTVNGAHAKVGVKDAFLMAIRATVAAPAFSPAVLRFRP